MPAHDVRLPLVCPASQIVQRNAEVVRQCAEIIQPWLLFSVFIPLVLAKRRPSGFCCLRLCFFSFFAQLF